MASYQINLETLTGSTLNEEYLKASLSVGEENKVITKLTKDLEEETTIENATKAYKLLKDHLNPKEEITYDLRLWMDSEVTVEETDSMNAIYESKVSISFSYMEEPKYLADSIKKLASEDENVCGENGIVKVSHNDAEIAVNDEYAELGLEFDNVEKNLKETEYRYCGEDPNNYVMFNDELWRIIGLVNTPEGQRIKLIRTTYESKAWNESNVNDWTTSSLKKYLNENYLSNLNEESKEMVDTIIWNLGEYNTYREITTAQYYNYERGTDAYNLNPTLWQGQIGLIYPSDYGYATGGGSTLNREKCLEQALYNWDDNIDISYQTECAYNDWLLNRNNIQWTLMAETAYSVSTFCIYNTGRVYDNYSGNQQLYEAPVLYLKSDVQIRYGKGLSTNPYILK